ncbi:unnamed protein product [Pleuronectes platessa]|uniref:Uncharacterized protein n=1 Tax=Pleuronectes platessa TaxID=8262 RepID=A0A9N7TZR5_PLEPL|nr:unnamed protein product [Pleuronectes platessa]
MSIIPTVRCPSSSLLSFSPQLPRHPAHLIPLPADELPEPSATPSSCSPASPFLLRNSRSHQHSLVLSPPLKNSRSHQHPVYPPCPTLNKLRLLSRPHSWNPSPRPGSVRVPFPVD